MPFIGVDYLDSDSLLTEVDLADALATGRKFRCLTIVDDGTQQSPAIVVDSSISGVRVELTRPSQVVPALRMANRYSFHRSLRGVKMGQGFGPAYRLTSADGWNSNVGSKVETKHQRSIGMKRILMALAVLLFAVPIFAVQSKEILPTATSDCSPTTHQLCLSHSRFKVTVAWQSPTASGDGNAISLTTGDTGYFWFFDSGNVELVVKVLDGAAINGHFWVFAAGLTNVQTSLRVEDPVTGAVKTYSNPQGTAFQPIQDTSAFATSLQNEVHLVSAQPPSGAVIPNNGANVVLTINGVVTQNCLIWAVPIFAGGLISGGSNLLGPLVPGPFPDMSINVIAGQRGDNETIRILLVPPTDFFGVPFYQIDFPLTYHWYP